MPYIKKKWRTLLDPMLVEVVRQIGRVAHMDARGKIAGNAEVVAYTREPSEAEVDAAMAGVFNYVITALAVTLTREGGYHKRAVLRIAMLDAAQEYYRMVVAPYEDRKAAENGAVWPLADQRLEEERR